MSESRVKLVERIRALMNKTIENGCSEAEAMSAMEMVTRLMHKHDLTMSEIELRAQSCIGSATLANRKNVHEVDSLLQHIGNLVNCRGFYVKNIFGVQRCFFGQPLDVEFAQYLTKMIEIAMETEWNKYHLDHGKYSYGIHGRTLRKSFLFGMSQRIIERIHALIAESETGVSDSGMTGTALVSLKNQLVTEEWKNLNIPDPAVKTEKVRVHKITADAGRAAGNRVSLTREVPRADNRPLPKARSRA